MKKLFCLLTSLLFFHLPISAKTQHTPLPIDQAFTLSAQLFGKDTVVLHWKIASKHYLYRDRLHFKILNPTQAQIGHVLFPKGLLKKNELLGQYEVYENEVSIPIPILHADINNTLLEVHYQGCSEEGYCYPPTLRQLQIDFNKSSVAIINEKATTHALSTPPDNAQEKPFFDVLLSDHTATLLLAFLGFGILLSLTPCVLPMIPILSGIIVGHQKTVLRGKSFTLSLVYVLSMAITYAIAGILVGWLGGSVQTVFQQPWVIALFSLLFVLLALSFFGLYALKLPDWLEERIANISRHQKRGHYLGVMMMGCLSTLIVSPCVTPALVGVLSYISKTGDAVLGGAALFMLGLGMGLPLLLIGLAGGKFLPKAGPWMNALEHSFGVLFLGLAIWMLDRIIPAPLSLMLWSCLLVVCSVYLGALSPTPSHGFGKLRKGFGFVMLLYGFLLAVGAAQGNTYPLQPLTALTHTTSNTLSFSSVKNLSELQTALLDAKRLKKPVLVDFYANWCVSCKEMEETTFKDPAVIAALKNFVVLKADITANDTGNKLLMQHFQVIAPPTFLLFDAQGQQLKNLTRVGKIDAKAFLDYLNATSFVGLHKNHSAQPT